MMINRKYEKCLRFKMAEFRANSRSQCEGREFDPPPLHQLTISPSPSSHQIPLKAADLYNSGFFFVSQHLKISLAISGQLGATKISLFGVAPNVLD